MFEQMVDIAEMSSPEYSGAASLAAFQWLVKHDGGWIDDAVHREFVAHPERMVQMVKALRAFAHNPATRPAARREALAVLTQCGFDDGSLRTEDIQKS